MSYKDPERQRAAMKRWRDEPIPGLDITRSQEYEQNRRPVRSDDYHIREYELRKERYVRENGPRRFVGCDGEGMGQGAAHDYYVFRMGGACLANVESRSPLTSLEILEFIVSQPVGPIYCIYSGNYDFTMVLRGLPHDVVTELLARGKREDKDSGNHRAVFWNGFRLDYIPHKRLTVARGGKSITIHDVFGFFQGTFVLALEEWEIGTEAQRERIRAGKERRGETDVLSPEELEYNREECELLEQMMHKLDDATESLMLSASPYEGAGAIANSLFKVHITKPIKERNRHLPADQQEPLSFIELDPHTAEMPTWDAYYGGRFEITAHGPIHRPVYEYDINSAYPSVIRNLPCLLHGKWVHENVPDSSVRFGYIQWLGKLGDNFGPLPHRDKHGSITFPLTGHGWYWSVEWPSDTIGNRYKLLDCWSWIQQCEHRPFYWVEQRYEQRKAHKAAGRKGQAMMLKLGYNSLYGKMAQNVGKPRWRNSVYAGLVTATCRRQLRDAAEQNPDEIVMFATDGLYSLEPLQLSVGSDLGQWELSIYEQGIHLVRPGIYFEHGGQAKVKSRGIARKVVSDHAAEITGAFDDIYNHREWLSDWNAPNLQKEWGCDLTFNGLVSLRLAYHQNHPERAGYFGTLPHRMSYNLFPKRIPYDVRDFDGNWRGGILRSNPPPHGAEIGSRGYSRATISGPNWGLDMVESSPDGLDGIEQIELEMFDVSE